MGIEDLDLNVQQQTDRILIVSEDDSLIAVLERLLDTQGYQWLAVGELEALSTLETPQPFDLVIYDYLSHPKAIAETVSQIKLIPELSAAAVLVITPQTTIVCAEDRVTSKSVEHLAKPINEPTCLLKINTLLRLRKMKTEKVDFEARILNQNAQLRDLTNRFKRELAEAQKVQQSLLPNSLPHDPRCLLAASYLPLEAVGGDFYDIWQFDEENTGFFIADVSGHGLPAAFIAVMTKIALSFSSSDNPALMLQHMNESLSPYMPEGRFITAMIARYDAANSMLYLARAGSPPGVLWREAHKRVATAVPDGMPLGITSGLEYQLFETELALGDKLMLFTDGLMEATNLDGTMFGTKGVSETLEMQSLANNNIVECVRATLKAQHNFAEGRILKDDITVLGLERVE